jgi:hypothetical protein
MSYFEPFDKLRIDYVIELGHVISTEVPAGHKGEIPRALG